MNIKPFLSKMLPHLDRSRIKQDIDSQMIVLEAVLQNGIAGLSARLPGKKYNSHLGKVSQALFETKAKINQSHIAYIGDAVNSAIANLAAIEKMLPDIFARDVTRDAMTFKKATILQYLSASRFVSDYAIRYLDALIGAEAAALAGTEAAYVADMLEIERKYLDEERHVFISALQLVSTPASVLVQKITDMEDLAASQDKVNVIIQTSGVDAVDPLRVNLLGASATANPFYQIGAALASWQVATHNRNKETVKALQLKLLALRDAQARKADPRLEQQIESTNIRIRELSQSIAEMEARNGR